MFLNSFIDFTLSHEGTGTLIMTFRSLKWTELFFDDVSEKVANVVYPLISHNIASTVGQNYLCTKHYDQLLMLCCGKSVVIPHQTIRDVLNYTCIIVVYIIVIALRLCSTLK